MARKGQAIFQLEINSDEEWKFLLSKPGLIVIDVYTEWCGPCTSMISTLKKTKVEVNSDYLTFAMANSNKIADLERFRGTAEPTWLFIASNQLLRVMYGCNAPELLSIIMKEFEWELLCIEGIKKRVTRSISTLSPEEEKKLAEKKTKLEEEEEEKQKHIELQWDKIRHRYYERVARHLIDSTVVVFFPHTLQVSEEGKEVCPPSNRLMGKYSQALVSIIDQMEVQLTKESIPNLFYNCGVLFPQILLKSLEQQPVIATLLQDKDMEKDLEFTTPSMIMQEIIEHLDDVERRVAHLAYGDSMNPLDPSPDTPCHEFMFYTPNGTAIPPFWTPKEHVSKAAAMEVLFPALVEKCEVKKETLPPPSYVVIFEARRAREVLDTAAQFAQNVMHIGFFDSAEPSEAQMVCQTIHQYQRLPKVAKIGLKMVLAVERTSSDPMLIMAQMGPLYISPDERVGLREVETFFPPMIDKVIEPDPWGPPPEHDSTMEEEEEEEEERVEEEEEMGEEMSEETDDEKLPWGSLLQPDEVVVEEESRPSGNTQKDNDAEEE